MISCRGRRRRLQGEALTLWMLALAAAGEGAGHGPVFGLATPTLGRGGWSFDLAVMGRGGGEDLVMGRSMLGYGLTPDLQLSVSVPLYAGPPPALLPARGVAMMPASRDAELSFGWRFHRQALKIGARFESTAWAGLILPTDEGRPRGIDSAPGVYAGAVTGYASRSVYAWVGGLYRRYFASEALDRLGDLVVYSLVFGYRPPTFRKDYPQPDWRVFVELVGEWTVPDRSRGVERAGTGGQGVYLGPTLLGLYGRWGISGGVLFRVHDARSGAPSEERLRFAANVTWWF